MPKLENKIRVGITMGDPSGIGPIIIAKAIKKLKGFAEFIIIGDRWVFNKISNIKYQISNIEFIDLNNVNHANFSFGKIRAEYGRASIDYLDKALERIKNKELDCLVTCPISKEAIRLAGFKWPGHTEYLAYRTNTKYFAMMLLNNKLKTVLVTRHIPVKNVSLQLKKEDIYKTVFLAHKSLRELFGIKKPRIVVCGLNPHASDNGLLGNEENKIIKPALMSLKRRIKYLDGPLSSDIAIAKTLHRDYDCTVVMYHDQALIPLKVTGDLTGVNLTLGLDFIRTSPLHGTAFDIAADYKLADPHSLIEAIKLAIRCTLNRKKA